MKVIVTESPQELGERAARHAADVINRALDEWRTARVLFSTGMSQLNTIDALVRQPIDWSRVEAFHLDEYVGLPETHPASFRKYLRERICSRVPIGKFHFVAPEGGTEHTIASLTSAVRAAPIDLGLIGIGENAHIAFNDPPADFETEEAFIVVTLDEQCRRQQVGEGWFDRVADVPAQAVTMTANQIMKCRTIISCVPFKVKARAVKALLEFGTTASVPATILKEHSDFHLYLDNESSSLVTTHL